MLLTELDGLAFEISLMPLQLELCPFTMADGRKTWKSMMGESSVGVL